MKLLWAFVCLILPVYLISQHEVYNDVAEQRNQKTPDLFSEVIVQSAAELTDHGVDQNVWNQAQLFDLDHAIVQHLLKDRPNFIEFEIPFQKDNYIVQLIRNDIFMQDAKVKTSSGQAKILASNRGVHYKGIIKGMDHSLVALSFFQKRMEGFISKGQEKLVISDLDDKKDGLTIIYKETAQHQNKKGTCEMPDDGYVYTDAELSFSSTKELENCVNVYVEIDHDIVFDKGGVEHAVNYIESIFNQSFVLYANDGIAMQISEIFAWDVPSPYSGGTAAMLLGQFQTYTDDFIGDIAHLVSYKANGGMAASFNGLCSSNPDQSMCFSSIQPNYNAVPAYSWTVMVITHEMGHLLGSRHTHACVWNGNGTTIDGCAGISEGDCPIGEIPEEGGTLMSYCHLQGVGVNFNLGFGPQPAAVIKNYISNATCLYSCDAAACLNGIQDGEETGVDCGGPICIPCPTCNDGIQNGDETGIDCGGDGCPICPVEYCKSEGTTQVYEYIESVFLSDIQNISGDDGGYGNYTALNTILDTSELYTMLLTPEHPGKKFKEYWCVWIDINVDGDFEDENELIGQAASEDPISLIINVPNVTQSIQIRMRVSMKYNGFPPPCGTFSYGEVEDYSVIILADGIASCADGIQNGDETGIDCGGILCDPCPDCHDGIQNGDETGIDCGGLNCPPCPTCDDGKQNGQETGVDCGGPDCDSCGVWEECVFSLVDHSDFEEGWGIWSDGGYNCRRSILDSLWANSGYYPVRLREKTESSCITSDTLDLSFYEEAMLSFSYITENFDSGEGFSLLFSQNGGVSFDKIKLWTLEEDFVDGVRYNDTLYIPGPFTYQCVFKFQNIASEKDEWFFIDDIEILACVSPIGNQSEGRYMSGSENADMEEIVQIFPNPAQDVIYFQFMDSSNKILQWRIINAQGKEVIPSQKMETNYSDLKRLDISGLSDGLHFIQFSNEKQQFVKKLMVQR